MSRPIAFLVDPVDEGSKASTSGDGTDRHAIAKARDGHRNSQLSFGSSDSQDYPLSSISSEDTSEEGGSSSQERSSSPVAAIKVVEEDIIQHRHICQGSDPLPYFDGRHGTSNADFLIDLETDSMERMPDVRPYFYRVGVAIDDIEHPPVGTPLVDYEQQRVRAGRLFLAEEQRASRGVYLVPRDWSKWNAAGSEWETLPYGPILADVCWGTTEIQGGEHGLDPRIDEIHTARIWNVLKTNVRAPLFPRELVDEAVKPGTRAWEDMVMSGYEAHPAVAIAYDDAQAYTCRANRLMTDDERLWSSDRLWRMYHWDGDTCDEDLIGGSLYRSVAFPSQSQI